MLLPPSLPRPSLPPSLPSFFPQSLPPSLSPCLSPSLPPSPLMPSSCYLSSEFHRVHDSQHTPHCNTAIHTALQHSTIHHTATQQYIPHCSIIHQSTILIISDLFISYLTLAYLILSYFILFYLILSYLNLFYLIYLQAAGRLSRKLAELEAFTAETLADLSLALFRDISLDKALTALSAQLSGDTAPSPSKHSSVGAAYACVVLQNDPSAASELRSFFASSASHHASQTGNALMFLISPPPTAEDCPSPPHTCFTSSHFLPFTVFAAVCGPLSRLKAAAGALLFDLCTAAPEKMVQDLRSDDVWCQGALTAAQKDGDHAAMSIISDNLLPLPAFTQVGGRILIDPSIAFSS